MQAYTMMMLMMSRLLWRLQIVIIHFQVTCAH